MLVLTRKANQTIQIGNDITITVLRVQGNQIRLGIEAPRQVRVVRGELEPLPVQEVTLVTDVEFSEGADSEGNGVSSAVVDQAIRVGGPLSGRFPRAVELAVANLSV